MENSVFLMHGSEQLFSRREFAKVQHFCQKMAKNYNWQLIIQELLKVSFKFHVISMLFNKDSIIVLKLADIY